MNIQTAKQMMFIAALLFFSYDSAEASAKQNSHTVKIYFFWGDGCPHCSNEKIFLSEMQTLHPEIEIESYEVWKNRANASFFSQMLKKSGVKSSGVPVTFIDRRVFAGFSDKERAKMEEAIAECIAEGCIDPADIPGQSEAPGTVDLPFYGKTDPAKASLPLMAVLLGGLDSFNPCAFFVLFFLLSLLIHAHSRTRMLVIGGTFIIFSGLMYFIFMAAWLNLFILAGNLSAITAAAGATALFVAAVNIKDFFWYKAGVSLSIPESVKPKLFKRMRNLLKASSPVSMLAGTAVLAIAANTYELLCTAGFPMVFTRILTLHNLKPGAYYLYLAIYNIVYIIPLAVIVVVFTVTLGARKVTEWQGRKLKLLSGSMMLFLGLTLLINPGLLDNIFAASAMLAGALLTSWAVMAAAKRMHLH